MSFNFYIPKRPIELPDYTKGNLELLDGYADEDIAALEQVGFHARQLLDVVFEQRLNADATIERLRYMPTSPGSSKLNRPTGISIFEAWDILREDHPEIFIN